MSGLKERFLKAGKVSGEEVEVDVDGQKEKFLVKPMSLRARSKLFGDMDPNDPKVDMEKMFPQLVIACTHDPETGEPVFLSEDMEEINELPPGMVDPIVEVAMRLSGVTRESVEEGKAS